MAIESARGAWPLSSLPTIPSSSASAASKVMFLTSSCSSCATLSSALAVLLAPTAAWDKGGLFAGDDAHRAVEQHRNVRRRPIGEAPAIIPPFEQRDQPSLAAPVGEVHQLARDPREILGHPVELRQRITVVGIEARRYEQEVRTEVAECRQDPLVIGRAHLRAAAIGWERRVDDIAHPRLAGRPGPRIKRHLVA